MKRKSEALPALPPPTEEEKELSRYIAARAPAVLAKLRQENLDTAVLLAKEAARGEGVLVDYFCELGRSYAHKLGTRPRKPKLRIVTTGGAA